LPDDKGNRPFLFSTTFPNFFKYDQPKPRTNRRDKINAMPGQSGCKVQDHKAINFSAGFGIVVREYPTDIMYPTLPACV
jgi:hypothetical protein